MSYHLMGIETLSPQIYKNHSLCIEQCSVHIFLILLIDQKGNWFLMLILLGIKLNTSFISPITLPYKFMAPWYLVICIHACTQLELPKWCRDKEPTC